MAHVMVDIETLGTESNSVILQVAAVHFGKDRNGLWKVFPEYYERNVTIERQVRDGRVVSTDTLLWWMDKVNFQARKDVFCRERHIDISTAVYDLDDFIGTYTDAMDEDCVWANSPTFDLAIVRHAMTSYDIRTSWQYWQERDVRTIDYLNKTLELGVYKVAQTAHNALDDARNQAQYVCDIMNILSDKVKLSHDND